jgi:hypothetical protein
MQQKAYQKKKMEKIIILIIIAETCIKDTIKKITQPTRKTRNTV